MKKIAQLILIISLTSVTVSYPMEWFNNWLSSNWVEKELKSKENIRKEAEIKLYLLNIEYESNLMAFLIKDTLINRNVRRITEGYKNKLKLNKGLINDNDRLIKEIKEIDRKRQHMLKYRNHIRDFIIIKNKQINALEKWLQRMNQKT